MRRGGVAAIDVGTSKIVTLVGGFDDHGRLRITGVGLAAAKGVSRGVIDDVGKATTAIAASIKAAERSSNSRIVAATAGISGARTACLNSRGTIALPHLQKAITDDDVRRALEGARTVAIPNNREILHSLPRFYVVDGEESYGDPTGRYGHRLDVEAHIVTGPVTDIHNLSKCIEGAGVQVEGLVLQSVAAADAVLDEEERNHGVVLADIGGGTTDIAVYVDGAILHTAVLPLGGNLITKDVVYGLRCPFSAADAAKEIYGHALPSRVPPDEMVDLESFGTERQRHVSRRRLCEIIQARVEEIFDRIREELGRAGYEEMVSAGIVLTGGTANLAGIIELAERSLGMPARTGGPAGIANLSEAMDHPAFSSSVGLLGWAVREHDAVLTPARARAARDPGNGILRRLTGWARIMLPE